ncbi:hypothetical protein [Neisseria meningitidis]|nr:hypothetical protein [Neisseria meningitidis]CWN20420.1 phage associated protein [Neisseria meningitidis]
MNIIEQEMKHSSLRKVDAEIAKIIADAHKIWLPPSPPCWH